jgi:hypothetical protein
MKLLFFCNLFIICSNAFTYSTPFLLKSSSSLNVYNNQLNYYNRNHPIINSHLSLKKNNDNNDNDNDNEDITLLSVNIIYNLILYSYIYYLLTYKH